MEIKVKRFIQKESNAIWPETSENFFIDSTFATNEDSTAEEAINMLIRALQLETFSNYSIVSCLLKCAANFADQVDIDFNKILSELELK